MKQRAWNGVVAALGAGAIALAGVAAGCGSGEPSGTARATIGPGAVSAAPAAGPAAAAARGPRRPVPTLANLPRTGRFFAILAVRDGARLPLLASPGGRTVAVLGGRSGFGSPVVLGVVRQRDSWLGVTAPQRPDGRLGWVRFDPAKLSVYWTRYSLRVLLARRTLELRYGGRVLARYTVTVGAPGSGTPHGRFSITDALEWRPPSPSYGCCALALSGHQDHLPIGWLGGDRIAIHGTPGPVGEAASHGCIRATDRTMRALFRRVPLGAPVFVHS